MPKPLVTIVVDSGNNRLHNIPVTFTVKEGGGSFAGQQSITVNSDSDGRSIALFTVGPDAGNDHNIVEANFAGNTGSPVLFVASSRVAGNELETSISGVVLDNSDIPVPGVLMRILGYPDAVRSDEKGHFKIKPAPVGNVRLIADGSTATRPGSWVWLQFDIVTIAGQDNDVGRPVRLIQMDMDHAVFVDETHGGTLTLPQAPGYSLNIAPGSVTFPNGSKSGHVSVTIVHPDKMPDPPSFGQQPRFLVSIQPANAVFNPPAQMCLPNLDALPPGQKTDMYSYDHDMERFISIGTGTVSEDGTHVCSDPGNGVIKGGWHCGGNPQTVAAGMVSSVSTDKATLTVCFGGQGTITATGSPTPSHEPTSFEWVAGGADLTFNTLSGTASTATVTGSAPGDYVVKVRYRCKSAQWSQFKTINVKVLDTGISGPVDLDVYCAAYVPSDAASCGTFPAPDIELTAAAPAGGTYTWSIDQGAGKVELIGPVNGLSVKVRGKAASAAFNDVSIKFKYVKDGSSCEDTWGLTVRKPSSMTATDSTVTFNGPTEWGYATTIIYTVLDQFGDAMGAGICVDETITVCGAPPGMSATFGDADTNAGGSVSDTLAVTTTDPAGLPADFCVKLDQNITAGGCGPLLENLLKYSNTKVTRTAGNCAAGSGCN